MTYFDSCINTLLNEKYEWIEGVLYKDGVPLYSQQEIDDSDEDELEELTISGEYWFDESGNTMYADGDIGDMNHEAYVIQRCASEIASEFNIYVDEPHLDSETPLEHEIVNRIIDEMDIDDPDELEQKKEEILLDPADAIINYFVQKGMPQEDANELVLTAYGSTRDAREYAIKKWGWSRVHGNSVEVNKLTRGQLQLVARGINNALNEEGICDSDEEWERAGKSTYNISTYSGKRYSITLDEMEKGNVSELEDATLENPVSAATNQLRKIDVDAMPDYYKQKGVLGDSTEFDMFIKSLLK